MAVNSSAQGLEVRGVGHDRGRRLRTFKQEVAKLLPISIVASVDSLVKPGTVTIAGRMSMDLAPGTWKSILRQMGLEKEETS